MWVVKPYEPLRLKHKYVICRMKIALGCLICVVKPYEPLRLKHKYVICRMKMTFGCLICVIKSYEPLRLKHKYVIYRMKGQSIKYRSFKEVSKRFPMRISRDFSKSATNFLTSPTLFLFLLCCLYLANENWILYILDYMNYFIFDKVL